MQQTFSNKAFINNFFQKRKDGYQDHSEDVSALGFCMGEQRQLKFLQIDDLPPLVDEEDDDAPPPLVEDFEEDDDSDSPPPLLDEYEGFENSGMKTDYSISSSTLKTSSQSSTHIPKVSTLQTRDDDYVPPLLDDDSELDEQDDEGEDDVPDLLEDEDEEDEEDFYREEESDDDDYDLEDLDAHYSSSDSDKAHFMREMMSRVRSERTKTVKPQPFPTVPNIPMDAATEEKRRKEWEEYKQKKIEEKLRRENLKKKRQELQEKQMSSKAATAQENVTTSPPTNKPEVTEALVGLGTCLNCTLGNKSITNKDEYYVCTCSNKCKLQFHKNCWLKYYRANRASDKSVICPTEACGYIEDLFLYDREEQKTRTKCPAPTLSSARREPPKKKSELFKTGATVEEINTSTSQTSKKKKAQNEKYAQQQQPEVEDTATVSNTDTSSTTTTTTTTTTSTSAFTTTEIFDENQVKVSVVGGKLAKAVEKKKLMDRALEETEKRKKKHLYQRTDFSIKPGHDVGIVVAIEPMRKVLTQYGYMKCQNDDLQLGDLIQFQIEEGNDYVRNVELIEQLENVPDNLSDLHEQLKENLKTIKEKFGVNIVFKFRSSKKKKPTSTSSKQQKKTSNKVSDDQQQDDTVDSTLDVVASSTTNNTTNTHTVAGSMSASSSKEGRRVFTMEDVSQFSSPLTSGSPWCLGQVLDKKETFGKIQVSLFALSTPTALQQQEAYFFHKMHVSKQSVEPQLGNFVIFTINEQNKGVTNIHVISNDLYEYYLTSSQ